MKVHRKIGTTDCIFNVYYSGNAINGLIIASFVIANILTVLFALMKEKYSIELVMIKFI